MLIDISSWWSVCSYLLSIFKFSYLFLYWVLRILYTFWRQILHQNIVLNIFLWPIIWLLRNIIFYYLEVNLLFTFMVYAFDVVSKKYLHNLKSQRFSSVCFSRSSIDEEFIYNSMTHFELTCIWCKVWI